jgi:peptidoglycan/xylan/chitin deacetylase (PgdA/CDA1 family)
MAQFVYFSKKRLILITALFVILLICLGGLLLWKGNHKQAESVIEPIYHGSTEIKAVALAVNVDWGEDIVPKMLGLFKQENIPATFFVTGRFASKFPDVVKQIDISGHEVGNHGYSHNHPDRAGFGDNQAEITKTEEALKKVVKKPVKLFAPPYGECSAPVVEAAEKLGYKTIMWTVDTVDWKGGTAAGIADKVVTNAQNGAIVLMHPKPVTLEALSIMIRELKAQGYEFQKISQIIGGNKSQNN